MRIRSLLLTISLCTKLRSMVNIYGCPVIGFISFSILSITHTCPCAAGCAHRPCKALTVDQPCSKSLASPAVCMGVVTSHGYSIGGCVLFDEGPEYLWHLHIVSQCPGQHSSLSQLQSDVSVGWQTTLYRYTPTGQHRRAV